MATEYKLSYTANDINTKLGKIGQPTSWNDLTDKPFGDTWVKIMPETEVTGVDTDGMIVVNLDPTVFPMENTGLAVMFDGVKYECPYYLISGINYFVFGNLGLLGQGPNTGEPFVAMVNPSTKIARMLMPDTEVHSVEISALVTTPIAEEYLPNIPIEKLPSVTLLYADSEKYLYADSDTSDISKRITRKQLYDIVMTPVPFYLWRESGFAYALPTGIYSGYNGSSYSGHNYGFVVFNGTQYYTAEYTAE